MGDLRVGPEAQWIGLPNGGRIELHTRRALRQIVAAIVKRHRLEPARRLTADELIEEGWPGERIQPEAASARLRVAISTLRKLGLKEYLWTTGRGYGFHPEVSLTFVGGGPNRTKSRGPTPFLDRFVGREGLLDAIDRAFEAGCRMVTLLGMGGVGKTRLAVEYALSRAGTHGEVAIVELGDCQDESDVLIAVSRSLGLSLEQSPSTDSAAAQIGQLLAHRGDVLFVVDSAEGAIDVAVPLISGWLREAAGCRVLATSRERLKVPTERAIPVSPLDPSEGLTLFKSRVDENAPVPLNWESSLDAAAELVARLEGIPLALELAAARARTMSIPQIRDRLNARLDMRTGDRTASPKAETLRACIAWSWERLTDFEKSVLSACSVFRGGFSLDGGEAVASTSDSEAIRPIDEALQSVVDQSMLLVTRSASSDAPRFRMYDTIRAYVQDMATCDVGVARERHAQYYGALGSQLVADLPTRSDALQELHLEAENLRTALRWSRQKHPDLTVRVAMALHGLYRREGLVEAHGAVLDVAEAAAESIADDQPRAEVAYARGMFLSARRRWIEAEIILRAATDLDSNAQLSGLIAAALAKTVWRQGRFEEAAGSLDDVLTRPSAADADYLRAELLLARAICAIEWGRFDEADEFLQEATGICGESTPLQRRILATLGVMRANQGRHDDAIPLYERAAVAAEESGDIAAHARILGNLGNAHLRLRGWVEAERAYARSPSRITPRTPAVSF